MNIITIDGEEYIECENEADRTVFVCTQTAEVFEFKTLPKHILEQFQLVVKRSSVARLVPVEWLENEWGCSQHQVDIIDLCEFARAQQLEHTSAIGRVGEMCLQRKTAPETCIIRDVGEQRRGIDLKGGDRTYQVKTDRYGGHKELGGTGNLYIEVAERNETKSH